LLDVAAVLSQNPTVMAKNGKATVKRILITGDAGPDYDIYLPSDEDNPPPGSDPAIVDCTLGGAGLAYRLLGKVGSVSIGGAKRAIEAGFLAPPVASPPVIGLWHCYPFGEVVTGAAKPKDEVWRMRRSMGLGAVESTFKVRPPRMPVAPPKGFVPNVALWRTMRRRSGTRAGTGRRRGRSGWGRPAGSFGK
jgi:hypothetical protein